MRKNINYLNINNKRRYFDFVNQNPRKIDVAKINLNRAKTQSKSRENKKNKMILDNFSSKFGKFYEK